MSNYVGLVYEYQCREHGTSNPIIIFRNLRYLHLCPKCKREMQKTYVDVKIFGDSLEHSGRSLTKGIGTNYERNGAES